MLIRMTINLSLTYFRLIEHAFQVVIGPPIILPGQIKKSISENKYKYFVNILE